MQLGGALGVHLKRWRVLWVEVRHQQLPSLKAKNGGNLAQRIAASGNGALEHVATVQDPESHTGVARIP